eukprot:8963677-Ditylum_brightwellii.AAC.1
MKLSTQQSVQELELRRVGAPTATCTPIMNNPLPSCGIVSSFIKHRRSRAIDLRFYWVRDRVQQGQFQI